jgi:WD40 repeat protein
LVLAADELDRQIAKIAVSSTWSDCLAYSVDGRYLAVGCRDDNSVSAAASLGVTISSKKSASSSSSSTSSSSASSSSASTIASAASISGSAKGNDNVIALFDTKSWSCRAKCRGHNCGVTHLDFSADGEYLRSASITNHRCYELFYWTTRNGKAVPASAISSLRDVQWATTNCVLSWETSGVWTGHCITLGSASLTNSSTEEIEALNISPVDLIHTTDRSPNDDLLVAGGETKTLKLFNYPANDEHAAYKAYKGHAGAIKQVQFTRDGQYLISIGGEDKAILQFDVKCKKKKTR